MNNITLNIPISKVDDEERMVWGIATSEAIDSQGDIVDYEASKRAFSSWIGNIREMHQPIAIGKAIDIQFDDEEKKVLLGVKISESSDGQNAWTKVKEGVLTGFSIGGKVFKTIRETVKSGDISKTVNRVTDYALSETSLVDNPACPEAQIVMVKSIDGHLQRVEKEQDPQKPFTAAWWVKSYMPTIENAQKLYDANRGELKVNKSQVKKDVYGADTLIDIACQLQMFIDWERYDGEDDQVSVLQQALDAVKRAAGMELAEGDVDSVVENAQKIIDLKKSQVTKLIEEKKVEKANVVGGVERDHEANVVADETPKDGNNVQVQPVESPKDDAPKEEPKKEEAPKAEPKPEKPAPKEEPKSEKSAENADLVKAVQSLLAKFDAQPTSDLQKVNDAIAKVGDQIKSLEERLSKVESAPVPPKHKASFVEVKKGEEEQPVDAKFADLQKRSDHLAAHPEDAKPGEIEELTTNMRKLAKAQ